jgi:hypothetical protein
VKNEPPDGEADSNGNEHGHDDSRPDDGTTRHMDYSGVVIVHNGKLLRRDIGMGGPKLLWTHAVRYVRRPHFLETSLACSSICSNLDWVIPKSALAARITRFGPHASTAHRRERCRPSGGPKSGQVVPEAVSTPNPVRLFRGT